MIEKGQFMKTILCGCQVEFDETLTLNWYANAGEWDCDCVYCRNFVSLAKKRQLPQQVLDILARLGIAPEKATYVCHLEENEDGQLYQFSYRLAGTIISQSQTEQIGSCGHEPYPFGAPGFPEPHFDLDFCLTLPWMLNEPTT